MEVTVEVSLSRRVSGNWIPERLGGEQVEKFCCKGLSRNEAEARGRSESRLFSFVEMEEITAHLNADKDNSVEREN